MPGIAYTATDLDDFAADLADLAAAVSRADTDTVWSLVCEIGRHDLDLSVALTGFLTCTELARKEVSS